MSVYLNTPIIQGSKEIPWSVYPLGYAHPEAFHIQIPHTSYSRMGTSLDGIVALKADRSLITLTATPSALETALLVSLWLLSLVLGTVAFSQTPMSRDNLVLGLVLVLAAFGLQLSSAKYLQSQVDILVTTLNGEECHAQGELLGQG